MQKNGYSRVKREFSNLSRRVNQLIISHEWEHISEFVRNILIKKLNSLYRRLYRFVNAAELRKILAAAAIFISFPLISKAQSFQLPLQNPFGFIPPQTDFISPAFADLDADDDLDMLAGTYEGNVVFYENTGSDNLPLFAAGQTNVFGLTQNGDLAFIATADIDNDGDIDVFSGGYYGTIWYQENTGTPVSPAFSPAIANPFGLTPSVQFAIPALTDIDDDGDLDLFVSEYYGNLKFYENTGTVENPSFAAPVQNPFGIQQAYMLGIPAFADIDHDGDMDLFEGEYYGKMKYFQNTGTPSLPAFAAPLENPFGLVSADTYAFLAFADIDHDGDADLFAGEIYGNLKFYENTEINTGIYKPETAGDFMLFPNPGNGKFTIELSGATKGNVHVFVANAAGQVVFHDGFAIRQQGEKRTYNPELSSGIYYLTVETVDGNVTRKLVIR